MGHFLWRAGGVGVFFLVGCRSWLGQTLGGRFVAGVRCVFQQVGGGRGAGRYALFSVRLFRFVGLFVHHVFRVKVRPFIFRYSVRRLRVLLMLLVYRYAFRRFRISVCNFARFFALFDFFYMTYTLRFIDGVVEGVDGLLRLAYVRVRVFTRLYSIGVCLPVFAFCFFSYGAYD